MENQTVFVTTAELIRASRAGIELWKSIPQHYPYECSTLGNIRNRLTGYVLKNHPISSRAAKKYRFVSLVTTPGKRINKSVHRLILKTFVGDSPLGTHHRDSDKNNNALYNICYMSLKENCAEYSKSRKPQPIFMSNRAAHALLGGSAETIAERMKRILLHGV